MVLGHLSQVIPAKAAPAGVVDGVPLDDVVRSEREGITPAPVEGIRRSLAVGQNDRTRQEVDLASDRLLREPEADQTSRVQFSPEGLEEAIGSRGHRIRTHRFQIELVPGSQVTLALGRPYAHAELDCLVDRPANPRVVASIAKTKPFGITGKVQNEGLSPRRAHESVGCLLKLSVRLQFELQRSIHVNALDGGTDQGPRGLRIGCERAINGRMPRSRPLASSQASVMHSRPDSFSKARIHPGW